MSGFTESFDGDLAGAAITGIIEWAENVVNFAHEPYVDMIVVHTMRASVEFLTNALDHLEHQVALLEAESN